MTTRSPGEEPQRASDATPRRPLDARVPATRVVDAAGGGDHATAREAIGAATPGDVVPVRRGRDGGGLVIDVPLEIVGDGDAAEIVIEAEGADTIAFHAAMGRVANLTIGHYGGPRHAVDLAAGRLDLDACRISGDGLARVAIRDGADPRLRRNRVHDGRAGGVLVPARGRGALADNDLSGNLRGARDVAAGGEGGLTRAGNRAGGA